MASNKYKRGNPNSSMTKKGKEGRGLPLNTLVQDFCFYFEQYFYLTCLGYQITNITNLNVERALVHPVHQAYVDFVDL